MASYTSFLTFKPYVGPKAGSTYQLPPISGDYKPMLYIDRMMTLRKEHEEVAGVHWTPGANPGMPSYGELPFVFIISQNYLLAAPASGAGNCYGANYAGMYSAMNDFQQYVLDGGVGILTETMPSGVVYGFGGKTVTSRSCTCVAAGSPQPDYHVGAPIVEWTCTMLVLSARWTYLFGDATVTTGAFH